MQCTAQNLERLEPFFICYDWLLFLFLFFKKENLDFLVETDDPSRNRLASADLQSGTGITVDKLVKLSYTQHLEIDKQSNKKDIVKVLI
jgi:hypothetical protein